MKIIRIGSGAGYAGDRIEPAVELIKNGNLDYICFECLAERTIALANKRKLQDASLGYDEFLEYRMEHILELCVKHNTKLISNMGAANPQAAAVLIRKMAEERGLNTKIAAVIGDDILDKINQYMDYEILERNMTLGNIKEHIVSANAYLGSKGIVKALESGANIVITGRVADPSIFLAPLIYEYGWSFEDYSKIGKGILCGHLLECSSQVCGGYFADPGYKEVPNLTDLGFPYAEVSEDGEIVIMKLKEAGGKVTEDTCKEQMLYEIQDPANYYTPDGIADFSHVYIKEIEKDKVRVYNATGKAPTGKLKVSIGYRDGFSGEGQISYGGSGAYNRAKIAGEIIQHRLQGKGFEKIKIDYIGVNSLFESKTPINIDCIPEVRLRVVAKADTEQRAQIVGNEVEALYLNGPAGGGGAEKMVKEIIAIGSIFIDEGEIPYEIIFEEAN